MVAADREIVIIGAGPAGLTAAYMLTKRGVRTTVLESDTVVGGISRTAQAGGWRFDIGGHRFFTKVKQVDDLWFEILGPDDFLRRPRLSRIHYRGKLYDYPITPTNALKNLGPVEAVRCAVLLPLGQGPPAEEHVDARGLRRGPLRVAALPATSSRPTTRRSGVSRAPRSRPTGARSASRASRSSGPSARRSSRGGSGHGPRRSKQVTSLIEEFNYPKYGPGQMWEQCAELVTSRRTTVTFDSAVTKIEHATVEPSRWPPSSGVDGTGTECTDVISSMPIGALLEAMDPPVPSEVLKAADSLRYRDFMTVALVVPE